MEACIANIGPLQRRRRLRVGALALTAAVVMAAALSALHAPVHVRALLFLPLYAAFLGFLQYRERT
jgi:hypothetical protein